ncbi:hypothetical protein [Candidatus Alkanophaga liquidiphilum]|nr:Mg-chelatase subunit ChlI [Candidatus Alkanophaga liquidiphilum]RLG39072.1 MAG: hypothetical protein DRN91_00835 [Candidatus Alkanophagales archaeon]
MTEFNLEKYEPIPVVYELRYSILKRLRAGEDVLSLIPDIDGREETKRDVIRAILSGASPFLVSEEGTGKTRLAKSLTKLLYKVPAIKGCPYHDDPKWSKEWLCPRCAESENPAEEFGIEFISPEERFSRIQGNEYTNFAKILGVKDIQVIREGKSPTDPKVFTGTGIFRGNRGIVFVDELPAIPTNVQVLFHPILEEGKVILEEFNLVKPVDIFLVATGNPEGFAHVNKIPRPLLDRLEMIYMGLPEEEVEKEIMLKEKFRVVPEYYTQTIWGEDEKEVISADVRELERDAALPWWIIEVIKKTVSYTRKCPNLEKGVSIRGGKRAIDHAYASVEMRCGEVANLRDACDGLKLSLRGRIFVRPDLIDVEGETQKSFERIDLIVEDIMKYAVGSVSAEIWEKIQDLSMWLQDEIIQVAKGLVTRNTPLLSSLEQCDALGEAVQRLSSLAVGRVDETLLNEKERMLVYRAKTLSGRLADEYLFSAVEFLANVAAMHGLVEENEILEAFFVPRSFKL